MLNINITLYIKEDLNYKHYYIFEGSDLPNENINILFIKIILIKRLNYVVIKRNNNHFDLLIKNNMKNKLGLIA